MKSEVYNVDCFKWLSEYNGKQINLIVTDPPYDIPNVQCGKSFMSDKVEWLQELESDTLTKSFDIEKFADLIYKVQKGKINIYLFCNKLQIPQYFDVFVNKYKCKFDILCWHKHNALPTFNCKYLTDTEYILYFRNKGGCNPQSYNDAKTYFIQDINVKDKNKWGHPTIKPLNIIRTLIRNSSNENDIICDTFLGSGTTRVASFLENRNFIGCEIDKQYYDIQEKRYKECCLGEIKQGNGNIVIQQSLF